MSTKNKRYVFNKVVIGRKEDYEFLLNNRNFVELVASEKEVEDGMLTGIFQVCGENSEPHFIITKDGKRHREDGPAYISILYSYWKNGLLHREDGPAFKFPNGVKQYYINGNLCKSEEDYKEKIDNMKNDNVVDDKIYTCEEFYKLPKDKQNGCVEYDDGDKCWFKEGKLHRDDGPAIERDNGDKEWCKEGKLHREDGPAIEFADGSKEWYKEGKLHREDGPAIEWADRNKEYWLNGKRLPEDWFKQHCSINTIPTPIKDSIMNAPEKIWSVREFNELPTDERTGKFVFSSGTTSYYRKGQLHRTDGPAIIDGTYTAYFFNGIKFDSKESIDKLLNEARALPNQTETTNATSVPSGDVSGHYEAAVQIGRKEILAQEDAKFFAAVTAAGVAVTTASQSQSLAQMLKSDFTKASYRVGATQLTKITKNVIIKLLSNKNLDSERMKVIRELLDSELGSSFIATILGYTLTYAPKISNDPRAKVMANEFRVKGMEILGNEIVNVAITNLLPEIQSIITSLPKETVRLEQPSTEKEEDLSSEEEVVENIITNVVELKHHKVK